MSHDPPAVCPVSTLKKGVSYTAGLWTQLTQCYCSLPQTGGISSHSQTESLQLKRGLWDCWVQLSANLSSVLLTIINNDKQNKNKKNNNIKVILLTVLLVLIFCSFIPLYFFLYCILLLVLELHLSATHTSTYSISETQVCSNSGTDI